MCYYLRTMGAGVYLWHEALHSHRVIELFSDLGMQGKYGESIGKGIWLHFGESMELSGCRRQEESGLSIMLYLMAFCYPRFTPDGNLNVPNRVVVELLVWKKPRTVPAVQMCGEYQSMVEAVLSNILLSLRLLI